MTGRGISLKYKDPELGRDYAEALIGEGLVRRDSSGILELTDKGKRAARESERSRSYSW